MAVQVDISKACQSANLPSDEDIHRWVCAAIANTESDSEVSIRIVDIDEITDLNSTYRHKNKATNVLSFPADLPVEIDLPLLGDVVVCAQVVEKEADQQRKESHAHWAHMIVHGTLHLQGYDHIEEVDADIMESREREILRQLNFPDPY